MEKKTSESGRGTSKLAEILQMLEREVRVPQARYALVHEGDPNEMSLMATRDGYLNLARQLIDLVRRADASVLERLEEQPAAWDDAVKSAGYILPSGGAFIVGAYVFDAHADLTKALDHSARLQDPDMPPLTNDPLFDDPEAA